MAGATKNILRGKFTLRIMEYKSVYIYGIIDGKVNKVFQNTGIGQRGDNVSCVHYKDVTAVVSPTPFEEYDPTDENVLSHENIIQEVLKDGLTIAPMRFCTVLKNKDEIMKLCQSCYLPFKKNILKIRGKQEFSVKAFLQVEKFKQEVKNGEELVKKSNYIASQLYELLKNISVDHVLDDQVTNEMVLNCSLLIQMDSVENFYTAVQDFDKQYPDKLRIRISGPTAPYNFVDMPSKPI
jgi:hypothetical protein